MVILGYASVGLLLIGILGMMVSMIWTFLSHRSQSATGIGIITAISVIFMVNGCLLAYLVIHSMSLITLIIVIIIAEGLSTFISYFVDHVMQALNKPNILEK